jgi:hypothetical protein
MTLNVKLFLITDSTSSARLFDQVPFADRIVDVVVSDIEVIGHPFVDQVVMVHVAVHPVADLLVDVARAGRDPLIDQLDQR